MSFYRRNLPHWQPSEAEYFITFRLAGTLPKNAIEYLKKERDKLEKAYSSGCQPDLHTHIQKMMFKNYEQLLDKGAYGPK